MSRYDVDPEIDYRRLRELADELTQFLTRLEALYLDAVAGFEFVRSRVTTEQLELRKLVAGSDVDSEEFQDASTFSYAQIFVEPFCGSRFHQATQGEVKARNLPGGSNYRTLGQLCVVALYAYWEGHLRREYVVAKGKLAMDERNAELVKQRLREHGRHDLWGDLGRLRNLIVHNQGIADSEVARCKLIRWFVPGGAIDVDPARMSALLLGVWKFRNQLLDEGFPRHYIQIPPK